MANFVWQNYFFLFSDMLSHCVLCILPSAALQWWNIEKWLFLFFLLPVHMHQSNSRVGQGSHMRHDSVAAIFRSADHRSVSSPESIVIPPCAYCKVKDNYSTYETILYLIFMLKQLLLDLVSRYIDRTFKCSAEWFLRLGGCESFVYLLIFLLWYSLL